MLGGASARLRRSISIAAFVCPMSHGVCRPVSASVLGETLDSPADIARIGARVAYDSMDLLQAPHTFSGVEMALWDLLGKKTSEPVWRLLGYRRSFAKRAYASQLFGDTPQQTLERARAARAKGFSRSSSAGARLVARDADADREQFQAAREGLGATPPCSSMPARSGAGTLRRRQRGCRTWRRLTPYGLRSPSLPVRFQPMRRSPSAARRSSSPEARPPTIPRWRSI